MNLRQLRGCFDQRDVEWRPAAYSKDRKRALALPYITNRAIMDRLDEVCGPENWRNAFRPGPNGGVICGLSIRVANEWVTKWDGADNTDIESVKGGLSNSMRRAAVQWGIGRYLYRLPKVWYPVNDKGRFEQVPALPPDFRVASSGDGFASSKLEPFVVVRNPRMKRTGTRTKRQTGKPRPKIVAQTGKAA